jgi:hypothetical protein
MFAVSANVPIYAYNIIFPVLAVNAIQLNPCHRYSIASVHTLHTVINVRIIASSQTSNVQCTSFVWLLCKLHTNNYVYLTISDEKRLNERDNEYNNKESLLRQLFLAGT